MGTWVNILHPFHEIASAFDRNQILAHSFIEEWRSGGILIISMQTLAYTKQDLIKFFNRNSLELLSKGIGFHETEHWFILSIKIQNKCRNFYTTFAREFKRIKRVTNSKKKNSNHKLQQVSTEHSLHLKFSTSWKKRESFLFRGIQNRRVKTGNEKLIKCFSMN